MDHTISFLDLKKQQKRLGKLLFDRIEAVTSHCQFILGPEVEELEIKLASYVGSKFCIGVSSGTDAIQIALMTEKVGPGDAVFLPAFTYTATAEVPLLLGATPVFVDIHPKTFQIDPTDLKHKIKAIRDEKKLNPKAIIGVDLFGQPAPWEALRQIAFTENLYLLDDCAQAFGAKIGNKRLGNEADATVTSFFPSKPLGCYGDGGAIFTNDPDKAEHYRSLRSHGEGKTRYQVLHTGINGRLDTFQAAILLAKLEFFDDELLRREQIACLYDENLKHFVKIPARVPHSSSAWAIYSILLKSQEERSNVQFHLKKKGIPTAIYYPLPLHKQPAYSHFHTGEPLPISESIADRILALPIHPELTDEQVMKIVQEVSHIKE
ncbi:UDP-2-acetamido-2-deoxy-3-oxo-D-glucuronate aminotransferase [Commensalibacter sp. Nvir]|uniref:DegT/DnrJ/EryC1/StrS family aminotransferase n=1 Tax=Commensalibacter sp. Nvir TaxID=3069817 RepID=UPI002D729E00|nr:UDP-2-acetamido-2-deoxy-3-oxo-D-glucuronate aminotransferase [Commensalibacter sp. Nvir]